MDLYAALFWIGFLVLIAMHATEMQRNTQHATTYALAATMCMFVGSKLGREFLGIR